MVVSADRFATEAGVAVLRQGGSAVDAAIAANAVLAVTSPHLCGMGGDLFALVYRPGRGRPEALNASGRSGSGADLQRLLSDGATAMPFRGDIRAVTVPGCVDGWLALHDRFGRVELDRVLAAAVDLAEKGFAASPLLALAQRQLVGLPGAGDLLNPYPVRPGGRMRRPGVGAALRAVTRSGRAGFYEGPFGYGLLNLGEGEFTPDDLQRSQAEWVQPLVLRVWGHDVWTLPPNSQGYLTLLSAKIAEGLALPEHPGDPAWVHLLVEAARAAGYDRPAILHERADVSRVLAQAEVTRRRGLVDPLRRTGLPTGTAPGGTTHICTADGDGMAVSLIQSNAVGFGALLFEPSTGIGLHNRGIGFSLDPRHPACYGPRRRPPHTLSPALVTNPHHELRAVVGTMGGDSQPQIVLQLLCRALRHGADPGDLVSAPRWVLANSSGFDTWDDPDGVEVRLEEGAPPAWSGGLMARGHRVGRSPASGGIGFGHAQWLEPNERGWAGAADPRPAVGLAGGY